MASHVFPPIKWLQEKFELRDRILCDQWDVGVVGAVLWQRNIIFKYCIDEIHMLVSSTFQTSENDDRRYIVGVTLTLNVVLRKLAL